MSLVNSASLCFCVINKKTTGFENYLSILFSPTSQFMSRFNQTFSLVFGEIKAWLNKSYKTREFNPKPVVYKLYRNNNCLRPKTVTFGFGTIHLGFL